MRFRRFLKPTKVTWIVFIILLITIVAMPLLGLFILPNGRIADILTSLPFLLIFILVFSFHYFGFVLESSRGCLEIALLFPCFNALGLFLVSFGLLLTLFSLYLIGALVSSFYYKLQNSN